MTARPGAAREAEIKAIREALLLKGSIQINFGLEGMAADLHAAGLRAVPPPMTCCTTGRMQWSPDRRKAARRVVQHPSLISGNKFLGSWNGAKWENDRRMSDRRAAVPAPEPTKPTEADRMRPDRKAPFMADVLSPMTLSDCLDADFERELRRRVAALDEDTLWRLPTEMLLESFGVRRTSLLRALGDTGSGR